MRVKGKREVQDLQSKQLKENPLTQHLEPLQGPKGGPKLTTHSRSKKKKTKRIVMRRLIK